MKDDWRPYELERLIEKMDRDGGLFARDLRVSDVLLLTVGGQVVYVEIAEPATGYAAVSSVGEWSIFLHLTKNWGSTLGVGSLSMRYHWVAPGYPLSIGPFITPPVTRILLNGFDLTLLDGRKPS